SPAELDAVVAHERAHLRQKHHLLLDAFRSWKRSLPWFPIATRAQDAVALLLEMRADDTARRTFTDLARNLIAKQATEEGHAAIRRLQMSADNIADSYARSIRRITEAGLTMPQTRPHRKDRLCRSATNRPRTRHESTFINANRAIVNVLC
ncbi:MAG: hypothetical protein J0H40_00155, partial [Rhizobiales bacterium]|nr:hypothetical protein [Hyphomicrobiales bacterium]